MEIPETRYARTADGLNIAYSVCGEGPRLLNVAPIVSNVELQWEHELYRRPIEHVARHVTLAQFDKRGIGLSDRTDEPPTLEQRIGDIVAVLDALGWNSANIIGMSEGGIMAQLFAATYPERVEKLVLLNSATTGRRTTIATYADSPLPDSIGILRRIEETWGVDPSYMVEQFAPSQSDNPSFVRWMGRYQRFSASRADFARQAKSVLSLNAGDAPERIAAPTLVIHVSGDRMLSVANGRMLADLIPGATYREVAGSDHFAWIMPEWRKVFDPVIEFVTGKPVAVGRQRRFATVLFTDIVDSTATSARLGDHRWREVLDSHDRVAMRLVDEYGGRIVKNTGDGLLAIFDAPSQGVACGLDLRSQLAEMGVTIRAGLHAGEIEVREDGDISGLAVNLAARVEQAAPEGELLVSSTVRDLLLGGELTCNDRGQHTLKGIDGEWRLYAVAT